MKIFRVYRTDIMGFDDKISYYLNKDKALKEFKILIKKEVKSSEAISKEDFSEIECDSGWNLVRRRCPTIIQEKDGVMMAKIFYWKRVSYEYQEYDIESSAIVLEEIEIIE